MERSSGQPSVLIVEDERAMAAGLRDNLEIEGYCTQICRDGEAGVRTALSDQPDLVLLDVMLPKLGGLDACRQLRSQGYTRPIVLLTARGEEVDKVVGLECGADDYITKPFGLPELLARIRAHLRRESRRPEALTHFAFGDVAVDFSKFEATRAERPLKLSPREYSLLGYLVQNRGRTVTREELLDAVWGLEHYPVTRTVDTHVAKLRKKVDDARSPRHIITVHRVGYRFLE